MHTTTDFIVRYLNNFCKLLADFLPQTQPSHLCGLEVFIRSPGRYIPGVKHLFVTCPRCYHVIGRSNILVLELISVYTTHVNLLVIST